MTSTFIAPAAVDLVCEFEGYHRRLPDGRAAPYLCPAYVPTIGFGSIWRADGSRVTMADPPITRAEAMALMRLELDAKCVPAVNRLITVRLHPLSHGALVSFVYNLGGGALKGSNLRRVINAERWADVPAEFAKWRVASGRILPGLVRRRTAETEMFLAGVAASGALGTPRDDAARLISKWSAAVVKAAA